jgi:type II secretory pathway pseudopilin PulG
MNSVILAILLVLGIICISAVLATIVLGTAIKITNKRMRRLYTDLKAIESMLEVIIDVTGVKSK